ncbi:dihydrolipoyllysine-residue acetyltransferase [Aestuariirhabdus litorea]|uniref:Dihydrolipoamide acetyltransferase component of pyruvate dehydrogenase complex n=1 Tax=Aestuariirhabdus litorea TaxID=2528527 RepID=A0A3P3VPK7_9GAMM|nr:dihydrolipoyllysine-residue acetyltransferase [Aestuariirhabdus litorea]RRJ84540.1 dihydrolipoyllysine-residue acetyltransferase [Aestuariirhabdus litorea]RWW97766.1 dihydrolipoyllysine-residue acetyltransferase [Endozoicomonadaceae bacterium GTF-13]
MKQDFILPDIGEGIVECELVEWLVAEGDRIEEDQPVADVMTDKALVQIPAPFAGRITKLYYRQGETAKVHAPLFEVEIDGKAVAAEPEAAPASLAPTGCPAVEGSGDADDSAEEAFILPDIGEGIVECEVVEWLVTEGERVEEDQPVVDLMTDKALVQIPAHKAGVITRLHYQQGEVARVHSPLFSLRVENKPATAKPPAAAGTVSTQAATPAASPSPPSQSPRVGGGKALASPAVRRIAREHQLDLSRIEGSGRDGRVLKEDLLRHLGELPPSVPERVVAAQADSAMAKVKAEAGEAQVRVEPIRGVRAAMARQMTLAASTIPHFTYGDEFDVTELLAVREQLKPRAEAQGVRLTLMPFIMKALAMAVAQYPILNSRVNADCTEISYLPHCNIGMAVDSKVGLLVPNIKRVESLNLLQIAAEVQRITEAAREGRVSQKDLQGGTISISNIGALGGTYAVPVINAPEVAIVALGKTRRLPRFNEAGEVVARSLMNVSWSGDHRVIDGGTIARFSALWQSYLEHPSSMLLELS